MKQSEPVLHFKEFVLDIDHYPPFEAKGGGFLPGQEVEKAIWLWRHISPNKTIPKFFRHSDGKIYYLEGEVSEK